MEKNTCKKKKKWSSFTEWHNAVFMSLSQTMSFLFSVAPTPSPHIHWHISAMHGPHWLPLLHTRSYNIEQHFSGMNEWKDAWMKRSPRTGARNFKWMTIVVLVYMYIHISTFFSLCVRGSLSYLIYYACFVPTRSHFEWIPFEWYSVMLLRFNHLILKKKKCK